MNGEHAPARILAIDDSEDMRDYYEAELELAGYSVVVAADGKEGLDLARELRPDLIITDVSMPEMDGLELLVRLRSDLTPPLPPIIVCSGFDMTASTALRLGAFRFLPKPLDRAKLLAVISLALQGAGASEETVEQEKERIHQARKRASAAAKAALQAVDFGAPDVATGLRGFADWIADYYGFGATAITFVDGGDLRVRAVSRGSSIATGTVFDGRALYSSGVLASGASLVISDAAAYPFAGERARQFGIRSFVGVPLASNGIPVGTICLFDAVPRIFGAEDLSILEEVGRGALSSANALPGAVDRIGLFTAGTFSRLLAAELLLHRRHGGSLDLVLVEHAPVADIDRILGAAHGAVSRQRFGVSRRGVDTLALFKRDPTPTGASRTLGDALVALGRVAPVRAAGWISLGDHLPSPSAPDLFELARGAFEQARASGAGTIERFELRRQPWRGVAHEVGARG